jgi:alkylmercury lyase
MTPTRSTPAQANGPHVTDTPHLDQLADRLTAAMPQLDATEQRITLALIRQLAHGAPVSASQLATATDLPEPQITDTLQRLPGTFHDDQHRVVGFMGLTVEAMGEHRIHLDERALSAWCAFDTLFLPDLLDETVGVTSRSPTSSTEISLTVTPTGPTHMQPPGAVVSFLIPETKFDANVIHSFCHFVHFFASPQDGEQWTLKHPGTFLLCLEDAYHLGQLTNHAVFGAAIPGGPR